MHLDYYKLGSDPFRLTPDYRFAFPHRAYQAARESMQWAIAQGDGVLVLSGRAGTGKTTLVQEFLESISKDKVTAATVVGTRLAESGFLQLVAHAFGLNPRHDDREALMGLIQRHLSRAGQALLVVDEAQNLSTATLEEVGLLCRLEVAPQRQLQVFLVGQEGLPRKLDEPAMVQLRQRVIANCSLSELDLQECSDYVMHRLAVAGWQGRPAIHSGVMIVLHRFSQGLPRHLCKLCSRLLLHGAVAEQDSLDVSDVAAVVEALREEMLLPNISGDGRLGPVDIARLQAVGAGGAAELAEIISLTAEEEAFLAAAPAVFDGPQATASLPAAAANRNVEAEDGAEVEAEVEAEGEALPEVEFEAQPDAEGEAQPQAEVGVPVGISNELVQAATLPTTDGSGPSVAAQAGIAETLAHRLRLPGFPSLAAGAMLLVALWYFFAAGPEPGDAAPQDGNLAGSAVEVVLPQAPAEGPAPDLAIAQPSIQETGRLELVTPQRAAIDPPTLSTELPLAEIVVTARPVAPARLDRQAVRDNRVPNPASAQIDATIEALLSQGERALARNYLTTPEETSAYKYYQEVLELDPGNETARRGMVAIADLYAVMANSMLEQRSLRNAGVFIRRGLFVLPAHPPLIALQWQLDRELASGDTASAAGLDIEKLAPAAL